MKSFYTILALVLIASSIILAQTTRLVDQGGTPGSYSTITGAVNAANSGDTIKVLSGIYVENIFIAKKLFMYAQDSTVIVVSGSNTFTFQNGSSGSLLYGFTLYGNIYHDQSFAQAEPIIISDNKFRNAQVNFIYWTIIANNYFEKGSGGVGIAANGSDSSHKRLIIFNNRLDSCGVSVSGNYIDVIGNSITNNISGNGISAGSITDCQLIANKITNCSNGIYFNAWTSISNFVVSNNLISSCQYGIMKYGGYHKGTISNNIIYNSTIVAISYEYGSDGSSLVYFYSNIFSNNAGNLSFAYSVWDNNCVYNSGTVPSPGSDNITSDPIFTNPVNGNFTLQTGSPAIDAGHPNLIYSDIDRTRNDMGIYGGSNTMSNYENLSGPKVINLTMLPTPVIKGNSVVITGSGISK